MTESPQPICRKALESDIPGIVRITNDAYVDSHWFKRPEGYDRADTAQVKETFEHPERSHFIVSTIGDALAGSVQYEACPGEDFAVISMLSVSPDFQQRGVGRALMQAAEGQAALDRKKQVKVYVVCLQVHLVVMYQKNFGYTITGAMRWPDNGPISKHKLLKQEYLDTCFTVMSKNI